ncbi:MAG: hypothetical protein HYZ01_13685 [Ignavibacteriales bacterium]|nr:hypothetical protein [Ignavibacteriales bacterium]
MGTQQLMLVILGVILVGIAIAVGISTFEAQSIRSNLDAMTNDMNHIAANAYQFKLRPAKLSGGDGYYSLYEIPPGLASNANATYTIEEKSRNEIVFLGTSAIDPANTITATINTEGVLGGWTYTGAFQ